MNVADTPGRNRPPVPIRRGELDTAKALGDVKVALENLEERLVHVETETQLCRSEVSELGTFLRESLFSGSLMPRAYKPPAAPAKTAGKYAAVALAIPAILQILSAFSPKMAGPITELLKLFGG
jgi:hypothetical protein